MGLVVRKKYRQIISLMIFSLFLIPSLVYLGESSNLSRSPSNLAETSLNENSSNNPLTQGSSRSNSLVPPIKPIITNVRASKITDTSAIIEWDTDIMSNSKVTYWPATDSSLRTAKTDPANVIAHIISLTGLTPTTDYGYEVQSATGTPGGVSTKTGFTFSTISPPVTTTTTTTTTTTPPITTITTTTTTPVTTTPVTTTPVTTTPVTTTPVTTTPVTTTPVTTTPVTTTPVTTTPPPPSPSRTKLSFTSNGQRTKTDTVEIDKTYTTRVRFVDTDHGDAPINNAVIKFSGDTDKVDVTRIPNDNGIYRIEIKPKDLGYYFIRITAEKDQYNSASATLYLNVVPIETDLYFVSNYQANELAMIKINETYTTIVQFNRTSITPETSIDDALINVFSSDSGVSYNISDLKNGQYQITVSLNQSKQTRIDIMASKLLHESDTIILILSSGLVETHLRFISTLKTTKTGTVQVYDIYTTIVQLNATVLSSELPIDSGIFEVHSSSLDLINTVIPLSDGQYQIDFEPTAIGQHNLDIVVSAGYGYMNTSATLTLIVEPIPTTPRIVNSEFIDNQLSFIYTDPIEIVIQYSDQKGGLIFDNFEYETDGLDFITYIEGSYTGEYIFSFEAPIPDTYHITITFYKTNYAISSIVSNIVVNSIPIVNTSDNIAVATEEDTKYLTIELINEIDGTPVTGATVTYTWSGGFGELEEQGNGLYVADLSNEELLIGSYSFYIIAEKANHVPLTIDYSIIVQDPEISPIVKFIGQYWLFITMIGGMAIGGTTRYIVKDRNKRRKQTLIEEQKQQKLEYITDISYFNELLVISPSGIPFYSFATSMNRPSQGIEPELYSSFLIAVKSFHSKTISPENPEKTEDYFRFGGTEIFLYTIRNLVFAYLFSAQVQDGEWKKVSHQVLEKCRELVIRIEKDFQDAIKLFEVVFHSSTIPSPLISEIVIEMLSLDFLSPHNIVDLSVYNDIGLLGERDFIQAIEQLGSEVDTISLLKIMEQLKDLEISPADMIFVFDQLREHQAIIPVT